MAKYNKQIVDLICDHIRAGDSQKLACKKAGIGDSTFFDWIHKRNGFSEKIKKAKEEFQATITGKLEATLWKRAMGYEVTETETEYVRDENGNPIPKSQKTKVKHIQPDTGALIFALTNVAPEKWINRQRSEIKELKQDNDSSNDYCFEDLPDDVLFEMADKLQDAKHEKVMKEKNVEKG